MLTGNSSYTDEGRLNYFSANNGAAPPPGYVQPVVSPLPK